MEVQPVDQARDHERVGHAIDAIERRVQAAHEVAPHDIVFHFLATDPVAQVIELLGHREPRPDQLFDLYFAGARLLEARLVLGVGRIQARQGRALLHLLHDPGLEFLLRDRDAATTSSTSAAGIRRRRHRRRPPRRSGTRRRRRSRSAPASRRRSGRPPTAAPRRPGTTPASRSRATPARSRTTPSRDECRHVSLRRCARRECRRRCPASVTPMASTTATQPAGIASIAARVEIGDDHDSGVARSSRAGTKRNVKARPTTRRRAVGKGRVPRIQTLRSPFFSSTVVSVAVETASSTRTTAASSGTAGFSRHRGFRSPGRRRQSAQRRARIDPRDALRAGSRPRRAPPPTAAPRAGAAPRDAMTPRRISTYLRTASPMPCCCS